MIDTQPTETSDEETPVETPARHYHIDVSWFDENNLSFPDVVRGRMCDACRAKMGTEVDERIPVFDKATGKMQFENRQSTFGSDPIRVIREHCGRSKAYITRDMPTLEAVFRTLLANGNDPMTLEEVREHLTEWCPGGGCQWLLLPVETLDRLVDNDAHYGLRQTLPPSE
jgi:hypothetical protein